MVDAKKAFDKIQNPFVTKKKKHLTLIIDGNFFKDIYDKPAANMILGERWDTFSLRSILTTAI